VSSLGSGLEPLLAIEWLPPPHFHAREGYWTQVPPDLTCRDTITIATFFFRTELHDKSLAVLLVPFLVLLYEIYDSSVERIVRRGMTETGAVQSSQAPTRLNRSRRVMAKIRILVEVMQTAPEAFSRFSAATTASEAVRQSESLIDRLSGLGLDLTNEMAPVPFFAEPERSLFSAFASPEASPDAAATTYVVGCEIDSSKLDDLKGKSGVTVWPNSKMTAHGSGNCSCGGSKSSIIESSKLDETQAHAFDLASSAASRVDCRPFRKAVTLDIIRELLAVDAAWRDGFRGQNTVVAIVDEGINDFYPVIGGFDGPGTPRPGTASIQSHGSMCAADVGVAAPFAKILDYPFLAAASGATSDVAINMFQAILEQRRVNGTPQLTSNSYGFTGLPPREQWPNHEAYDPNHPLNRKVREVIASGAPCFFSAGNCGQDCPSGACYSSAIGPNKSISAANSLPEVITVAAANSRHERIGYSAQGPGTLHAQKPDVSAYSHFFGNFGPGRPANGGEDNFDNGTSASCPIAAGVGALLMSAFPNVTPEVLRRAMEETAINLGIPGWDADTGHGIVNAGAAYAWLKRHHN
jgi:serine protease AprX